VTGSTGPPGDLTLDKPPAPRRVRRRAWTGELSWTTGAVLAAPVVALTAALMAYPLVTLFEEALAGGGLSNVTAYFERAPHAKVLWLTFLDSAIATVVTIALGGLLAWTLRTTNRKSVRLLILSCIFVPFWMGAVLKIYALTLVLGERGLVNRTLDFFGLGSVDLLYTQFAVIVGLVYQLLPYAALPLYVTFLSIDLTLIRAAEGLGASRDRAVRDVVVPLVVPGVLASFTVVFILAIGFYLTPVLLGGAGSPFTASLIDSYLYELYDLENASLSAAALLVGGMLFLALGLALVGRERLRRAMA
jgi:ABC-type spermidine/putrescine transport system permease subunit I